jgi:hypothetical protein
MKVFTVVIRNVTDKLNKHKTKQCESEEFRAGPLFLGLWRLNWCSGAGCTAWLASYGSAGLVVFWNIKDPQHPTQQLLPDPNPKNQPVNPSTATE